MEWYKIFFRAPTFRGAWTIGISEIGFQIIDHINFMRVSIGNMYNPIVGIRRKIR